MEKIYLLVDEIKANGFVGETNDIKKVYYNLELIGRLGEEIQQRINIKLLLDTGAQAVFSLGRFICVVKINKDDSEASMGLFDCVFYSKDQWQSVASVVYPNHVSLFMKSYEEALSSSFSSELDSVELSELSI